MTLRLHVDTLINPHLTTGPDGEPTTAEALLDRLEAAVKPETGSGPAASTSSRARIPIDDGALALLQDIDAEARELHDELTGNRTGTLRGIIRGWACTTPSEEWEAYLGRVTLAWCDRITAYLDPVKVYRPSVPCPACGARFHGEERRPAVLVEYTNRRGETAHPEQWVMRCSACEAEWTGDALGAVAHAIQNAGAA